MGPTATGKTAIGAQLAKLLNGEVISADSQLVYRQFDIGTAKPSKAEKLGVAHHMIDVAEPTEQYAAGRYAKEARPILERLIQDEKPIVIVGGTGFYIRSLLQPAHIPNVPPNPSYRRELADQAKDKSPEWLHQQLQKKDPHRASQIELNDTNRIIRALEIIEAIGGPIPETPRGFAYPVVNIGLHYEDRQQHVQIINSRLNEMLKQGFYEEAVELFQQYGDCPALNTAHGYRHLIQVHQGELSLDEAREAVGIMIRQYSKRQMTWLRSIENIHWYDVASQSKTDIVKDVLALTKSESSSACPK